MTSQSKYLIELSDLLAFTFTCKQCGVSVSVPIAGDTKANRLDKCPTCDEPWLTIPNVNTLSLTFEKLQWTLKTMAQAMKEREESKCGFTLALEISAPVSSATD